MQQAAASDQCTRHVTEVERSSALALRIILLNQFYAPDGAATAQMLGDLGAGLAAAGHEVMAICSNRSYADPHYIYPREETIEGVRVHRVRSTPFGRGSRIGRFVDYFTFLSGAVWSLLFGPRADIVVVLTTPPMMAYAALLIRRIRRFKVVFWSMDVYPDVAFALGAIRKGSISGRLLAGISRRTLRAVDITVALGETMAERLRLGGATCVEVIHNWADERAITPRDWRDGAGRFIILYSGNLGLAHEFDTVIEAARRLERTMPEVIFKFIGGGPRSREVRKAASTLANVEFHDYVDRARLGETLSAADVHLITLRSGMAGLLVPSKIYGILAAGRPTIYVGPDEGEVADIVREGHCGVRVANGDVEILVEAIREYASDPLRRARDGVNARAIFERQFTREKSVRQFRQLLENLNDARGAECRGSPASRSGRS
jgi:colanic acid biosynthesis glycosyl transferase WcaI